jgi:hypothetical protein
MAGAICQNRTLALEAREEIASINLHMDRAEKNINETKEYLLIPNQGLDEKLTAIENAHNQKIANL